MEEKRCYGCMRIKGEDRFCPFCGYSEESANPSPLLRQGSLLRDRYLVGRVLGDDNISVSYLGWDRNMDIPVVIDECWTGDVLMREADGVTLTKWDPQAQSARFEKELTRFFDETKLLAKLGNVPQLARVYDFFRENKTAYRIREYVQGVTLKDHVLRLGGRLGTAETFSLLGKVMEALERVHSAGLIHRAVRPENILLLPDGGIKLNNFCTAEGPNELLAIEPNSFAPLEWYQKKEPLGPWSDVYGLCATAYFCLAGRLPPSVQEQFLGEYAFNWQEVSGLTAAQRRALKKGTALKIPDRIQSAGELRRELAGGKTAEPPVYTVPLQPVSAAPGQPEPAPSDKKEPASPKPRKKSWIPILAVILAAVLFVGGFFVLKAGDHDPEPDYGTSREDKDRDRDKKDEEDQQAVPATLPSLIPDEPATEATLAPVEKVELTLYCDTGEGEFTRAMIDRFQAANPQYLLDIAVMESPAEGGALSLMNGGADVVCMDSGSLGQLDDAGVLLPWTGAKAEAVMSQCLDGAANAMIPYQQVCAAPYGVDTWFMYYNKRIFSETDVVSLNRMLGKGKVSFPMNNSWYLGAFFYATGCNVFGIYGTDPSQCDWNSELGVTSGNYLYEMARDPNFVADDYGSALSLMCSGELGAMFSGTWDYPALHQALGDDLGACALPVIEPFGVSCQLKSFAYYRCYAISDATRYPEAAQELVLWLTSPEVQRMRYEQCGVYPIAPALLGSLGDDVAAEAVILQTNYTVPQPMIPKMADYWDPVTKFGNGILDGSITDENMQEALDSVAAQITG